MPTSERADLKRMGFDGKCTARSQRTGEPCRRPAARGANVCPTHGGSAPQVKAAAQRRLNQAADVLVQRLLGYALDGDAPDHVALAAIRDALDRAGLGAKQAVAVDVKVEPWEELMAGVAVVGIAPVSRDESRERRGLPALAGPTDPDAPIDAEVVEDPARDMGAAHPGFDGEPPNGDRRGFRPDPASASGPSRGLMTMEEAVDGQRAYIRSSRIRRRS